MNHLIRLICLLWAGICPARPCGEFLHFLQRNLLLQGYYLAEGAILEEGSYGFRYTHWKNNVDNLFIFRNPRVFPVPFAGSWNRIGACTTSTGEVSTIYNSLTFYSYPTRY